METHKSEDKKDLIFNYIKLVFDESCLFVQLVIVICTAKNHQNNNSVNVLCMYFVYFNINYFCTVNNFFLLRSFIHAFVCCLYNDR